MREMNSLVSSPLRDPVFSSYALSACTGHTLGSSEREGKKNSVMGFPWRDCLARERGRNATPSGLNCLPDRSSWERSADLEGRVNASSMTIFHVRCLRVKSSFFPRAPRKSRTSCTFHVLEYLGSGGLS